MTFTIGERVSFTQYGEPTQHAIYLGLGNPDYAEYSLVTFSGGWDLMNGGGGGFTPSLRNIAKVFADNKNLYWVRTANLKREGKCAK